MNLRRKQANRLGFAFAAYIVAIVVAQMALVPFVPVLSGIVPSDWMVLMFATLPNYLIGLPLYFFLTRRIPATPIEPKEPWGISHLIRYALMGLALGYIFSIVGNFLNTPFVERFGVSENVLEDILKQVSSTATFVFIVIAAPILEELVFRRRFLDRAASFGRKQAVLAGGLAFGLFHMNIPQFTYAFALGVFWGVVYLRHGSYPLVVLLHMIVNGLGTLVLPLVIADDKSRLVVVGVFVITVMVLGLILLVRERTALREVLRDPVPEPPEIPREDGVFLTDETQPLPERPRRKEKQPSLLFNPGMLLYYALIVILFVVSLVGPSVLS